VLLWLLWAGSGVGAYAGRRSVSFAERCLDALCVGGVLAWFRVGWCVVWVGTRLCLSGSRGRPARRCRRGVRGQFTAGECGVCACCAGCVSGCGRRVGVWVRIVCERCVAERGGCV
jgi:hypothetical protein